MIVVKIIIVKNAIHCVLIIVQSVTALVMNVNVLNNRISQALTRNPSYNKCRNFLSNILVANIASD